MHSSFSPSLLLSPSLTPSSVSENRLLTFNPNRHLPRCSLLTQMCEGRPEVEHLDAVGFWTRVGGISAWWSPCLCLDSQLVEESLFFSNILCHIFTLQNLPLGNLSRNSPLTYFIPSHLSSAAEMDSQRKLSGSIFSVVHQIWSQHRLRGTDKCGRPRMRLEDFITVLLSCSAPYTEVVFSTDSLLDVLANMELS